MRREDGGVRLRVGAEVDAVEVHAERVGAVVAWARVRVGVRVRVRGEG